MLWPAWPCETWKGCNESFSKNISSTFTQHPTQQVQCVTEGQLTVKSEQQPHKNTHTNTHTVALCATDNSPFSFQHKNKSTWVILWQWTIELDNKSDFNINYIFFCINYELKIICLKGLLVCIHFSHEALISTRCSTVAQDFLHPHLYPETFKQWRRANKD